MQIINALQAKKGAKTEQNRMGSITQPLQFIPKKIKLKNGQHGILIGWSGKD